MPAQAMARLYVHEGSETVSHDVCMSYNNARVSARLREERIVCRASVDDPHVIRICT